MSGRAIPPKPSPKARDNGRTFADALIAAVPVVGGSSTIVLNRLLTPSIDKRTEAWFEQLAAHIEDLLSRVGNLNEAALAQNELFVSGVIQASHIAQGTARSEKTEMLHAAVLNIATGQYSDDFLTQRFLAFIEELTPEHFTMLAYATDPSAWHPDRDTREHGTPLGLIYQASLPFDQNLVPLLLADLEVKCLINSEILGIRAKGEKLVEPFSTNLGLHLVQFVTRR